MTKAGDMCYKVFKGQKHEVLEEAALFYKWAVREKVNFELRRK